MSKYRIKEVFWADGGSSYYIQKRFLGLWFTVLEKYVFSPLKFKEYSHALAHIKGLYERDKSLKQIGVIYHYYDYLENKS